MGNPMIIRASVMEGVTEVKVKMQHIMETGLRKASSDPTGKTLIPAWHITKIKAQHNGRTVLEGQFGTAVSKNPYLVFRFKGGAPGEKVSVNWVDNKGDSRTDEAEIK